MLKEPKNPVYEPIILFEVRHVKSDMLSGVTKTEQTNVGNGSMACLPGAGRILSKLSCVVGVCDAGVSEGLHAVMTKA